MGKILVVKSVEKEVYVSKHQFSGLLSFVGVLWMTKIFSGQIGGGSVVIPMATDSCAQRAAKVKQATS